MVKWDTFGYDKKAQIPFGSVAELVDAPDLKSVERFSSWGFMSPHSHFLIIFLVITITLNNCYVLTKKTSIKMENIFNNSFATLIAYVGVISFYLLVIPLLLFYWMNNRWNVMGKFERLGIYGLVFLFFPGLILFSPFLNLRLRGSGKG